MNKTSYCVRSLICALLAAAAFPATGADPDVFNIAGVVSFSGPFGIVGNDQKRGVELAIDQRGAKVLGKPIRVTWEDDETKAQVAVQKASRMIGDGAHMIFGATGSGSTLALQGLSDQRKIPLLVTWSADDKLARRGGSRYTFRTSNNFDMEMRITSEITHDAGLKKIYGVVLDVGVGRDGWDLYAKKISKSGIKIVGVDYTPLGTRDFSVVIDKIAKTDADGVMVILFGSDAVSFLKQSGQVKLGKSKTLFGPVLQDETHAAAVGPDAVGAQSAMRYHFTQDSPANKTFVANYRAKYKEWPSAVAGEAYDGMSWWLDTVDATKSWDKEKWIAAFERSAHENSLEGKKVMRTCDHQAAQVGLWGVVIQGKSPLPALTMKITKTFSPEVLFDPC